MRRFVFGTAVLGLALIGASAASAQVGVYVDRDHDRDHWRRHHEHCRTVVTHRMNDRGDRVTVRKRVCD